MEKLPFLVSVSIEQILKDGDIISMKSTEEFTYGKDLKRALANCYNEIMKYIRNRLEGKENKLVIE